MRASDLDWVIVRPMILTNGPWTNDYRAAEDLKPGRRPYISRRRCRLPYKATHQRYVRAQDARYWLLTH